MAINKGKVACENPRKVRISVKSDPCALFNNIARPPKPKPVAVDLILEDLSSVRRTYDLPGRMTLPDIVEVLVDIWDV